MNIFLLRSSSLFPTDQFLIMSCSITVIRHEHARADLTWHHRRAQTELAERFICPRSSSGMAITFQPFQKHAPRAHEGDDAISRRRNGTASMPEHYRGAPALVRDDTRPRTLRRLPALRIHLPAARDQDRSRRNSGRRSSSPRSRNFPHEFDIDMIRCIYCGMCEEVCPEQAIFLRKDYAITGFTRAEMVHDKEKLLETRRRHARCRAEVEREEMKRSRTSRRPISPCNSSAMSPFSSGSSRCSCSSSARRSSSTAIRSPAR